MRLICPNCSAQYEIDTSLIPDEGRDVQCSNCGHNWFELPPAPEGLTPPPEMPVEDVAAEPAAPEKATPETGQSPQAADDDEAWPQTDDVEEASTPPPSPQRPRRTAAVEALDVLREEAARELARRREEEPAPIETQPDLALADPRDRETPSRALRARMARLRGEDDEPEDTRDDDAYRPPRRDLLPDIDEINSSLKPANARKPEPTEAELARHRRGFRLGFLGAVGIAIVMILAYAKAPAIASTFPGTEVTLIGYVDWANGVRDTLNAILGS